MKITQIDLWHASIPTPAPFRPAWIPGMVQTENRFTLLRLRTASGLEGWAAGTAMGRERAGLGDLLGPYLLGERADDLPSIRQRVREMGYLGWRTGWLEVACWDVIGKARDKPLWELLGGEPGEVELYASTGEVKTGEERVREVEDRAGEGFGAVKLRVHADTLEEDVAQVRETRAGVGDDVVLGVDANQGWRVAVISEAPRWDYERALRFCRAAEEAGVAWVEEPLPMDAYADIARLRAETEVAITGGELHVRGLPEFRVMLEKGCYDWYQPDATFTGGIAETWRIAQEVTAAGCLFTPHTWTNGIGLAVGLHLLAASPSRETARLEYPYAPPGWVPEVRDGLLAEPWLQEGGVLPLPTRPGLGFEIDPWALRRYASHFFRATKARVAVRALLDRGPRVAMELGRARGARLTARSRELDARGEDHDAVALGLEEGA